MNSPWQSLSDGAWARHFRFFRLWLQKPREVGAILPSSPALAQAMADRVDPAAPGAVVEFGGGTGSITKALLRKNAADLFVIEREPAAGTQSTRSIFEYLPEHARRDDR